MISDADPHIAYHSSMFLNDCELFTVLIMARTVSTPKVFYSNNVSAIFTFVGLLGAALTFSNLDKVYALDTGSVGTGVFSSYVPTKAKTGEGSAHLRSIVSKMRRQSDIHGSNKNATGKKRKVHSKKYIVSDTVKNTFLSFGHNDQSTFILVSFDGRIVEPQSTNLVASQSGNNVRQVFAIGTTSKVLKVENKTRRKILRTESSPYSTKRASLKLIAGGNKNRTEIKKSKFGNSYLGEKYRGGITGLQEVVFAESRLKLVAGNSRNKLGSYIANNCRNVDFCVLPDQTIKQQQPVKKIKLTSLVIVKETAASMQKPAQTKPIKVRKIVAIHATDEHPTVIMLDKIFE